MRYSNRPKRVAQWDGKAFVYSILNVVGLILAVVRHIFHLARCGHRLRVTVKRLNRWGAGDAIFMIKQENVREIHVIMMIGNTVS